MRDAAETIARQSDDFAPSLATRVGRGLARIWSWCTRHARARRDLAHLRALDRHGLADLGLRREDLYGLDDDGNPRHALRRLRLAAENRISAWAHVDPEARVPTAHAPEHRAAEAATSPLVPAT